MKDLAGLAAIFTALAAAAALVFELVLGDTNKLQNELARGGLGPGEAKTKATSRRRVQKLVFLGVPLIAAFGLSAAAFFASGSGASAPCRDSCSAVRPLPFRGSAERIDAATRARMTGVSWHRGCPVGFAGLRLLTVSHWGFDGRRHLGRLVVNRDAAAAMLAAMHSLYRLRFPIRQMRLVDAYAADDHRSMAADNTSAFNCRFVAGSDGVWSEHAYGRALDLNPLENPYVTESGFVSPPAGTPFADRSRHRQGMVHRGGPVVDAFVAVSWEWGGNWAWPKDYQHFSKTGR